MFLINRYWFDILITIGIIIGGEGILVPAIYFSFFGLLSLGKLMLLAVIGNLIADTIWYAIGRFVPFEKLKHKKIFRRYTDEIEHAGNTIKTHGLLFLFISKFVVGTRTIMQLLCGINKISVVKYAIVNSLGIIVYVGVLYGLSFIFRQGLAQFKLSVALFEGIFAAFFILVILASILLGKKAKDQWFQL